MDMDEILRVRNLNLYHKEGRQLAKGVNLTLRRGETLGLVGESGSGKTLTLKAVMGLLPAEIYREAEKLQVLGNCAMIFQNPSSALDPLCPVFKQLCEIIRLRQRVDRKEAAGRGKELLERLSLPEELARRDRYPWELSGGQCQRILIAMALACQPEILLCDEPTTALDVTVQKKTLELIKDLQKEHGFAVLFVTHNLAVAADLCSRLAVMEKGTIVEEGPTEQVLHAPQHAYTKMLLQSVLTVPEKEA